MSLAPSPTPTLEDDGFESDEHRAYAEELHARVMRKERDREMQRAIRRHDFGPHPLRDGHRPLQPWDEDIHVNEFTVDDLDITNALEHRRYHVRRHELAKKWKATQR